MRASPLVTRWAQVAGVLFVLLGVAHLTIAVPDGVRATASLPRADALPLMMADITTGVAVLFAGLLTLRSASGLGRSEPWARFVASLAGVLVLVAGVGYVFADSGNPFAWIALAVALAALVAPLLLAPRRPGDRPSSRLRGIARSEPVRP